MEKHSLSAEKAVLRTPEDRFNDLPDFPFTPRFLEEIADMILDFIAGTAGPAGRSVPGEER